MAGYGSTGPPRKPWISRGVCPRRSPELSRQMLVKLIPEKWHDRGVQIIDTPRVWPVLVALMRARTQVLAL